jgi:hypothetical protein
MGKRTNRLGFAINRGSSVADVSTTAGDFGSSKFNAGGSGFGVRDLRPGDGFVSCSTSFTVSVVAVLVDDIICSSILDLDKIFIPEKLSIAGYQMETFTTTQFLALYTIDGRWKNSRRRC